MHNIFKTICSLSSGKFASSLLRFGGIRVLLCSIIFISSCHDGSKGQGNTQESAVNVAMLDSTLPAQDPYFAMPQDTISTRGPRSITRNTWQDKNGNYWLASWEGIVYYDGKQFTNITLKEGLRQFHVFSILEDREGHLWFGTIGAGAYYYDGKTFSNITTKNGIAGDAIDCILEDSNGNIWFGTDKGASCYNRKSIANFTTREGLSGNFVHTIMQDKTGKIWLGTDGGVSCYNGKSFTVFRNEKGQPFNNVRSIIEDRKGNIWIGSQDGLSQYDGKLLTCVSTNFTGYIFEDKAGNLWLSQGKANSSEMTLTRYDGKSFHTIKEEEQVFGIMEDREGSIWFGTVNGAYRYDGQSFTNFWTNKVKE